LLPACVLHNICRRGWMWRDHSDSNRDRCDMWWDLL